MQKDYKKIIEEFGIRNQATHFMSECVELFEAIVEYDCEEYNYHEQIEEEHKKHIEEEVADVLNFLEQFIIHYELDRKKIKEIQKYKNKRTLYEKINNINKKDRKMAS